MAVIERLAPPLPGPFAPPRPDMCGRYLIRNPRVVRAFAAMDAALSLVPVRRPPVPVHVQRLLVANWAHLGDVTTALGTVRWLRARFPDAQIGMVVGSWGRAAAEAWGLIDRFHVIDHWSLNRSAATSREKRAHYRRTRGEALREIVAADYQLGIDLYPYFPPAHPLFHHAGIPVRVGFDSGGWGPLLTHPVGWPDRDAPIADHNRDLILAAWPEATIPSGAVRPTMDRTALPPLPTSLADGMPFIVLHPGTGAETRDWGIAQWIELAGLLDARPDAACRRIVVTGAGARDVALAAQLAAARPEIVNLSGQLAWDEFLGVLARAALIVCPDTVTSHLGAMFDTPLVCVATGIVKPEQWGPYSDAALLLTQAVACAPCNRWGCEAMACIRQTSAAQVMAAIGRMMPPPV